MPSCTMTLRFGRGLMVLAASTLLLMIAGCGEETGSPAGPEPSSVNAGTNQALVFRQLSGGNNHTCGVTTTYQAYCWGRNSAGGLGDGTTDSRSTPVPVAGGLSFRQVTAGGDHSCGITTENQAYCWGAGGMVGDGSTTPRLTPVPVAGGHEFLRIDAGHNHTCAVSSSDRRGYCWGSNSFGQLGDGTEASSRPAPQPVAGGHRFRHISVGFLHSCGVTTGKQVFCWGSDRFGQVGDGSALTNRRAPSRVASAREFRQVDAGFDHSCAVTTDDRAFCWGAGGSGQVGDGKTLSRFTPRAVVGGMLFERVTAGNFHTCGETPQNRAYCWGANLQGQLGDGTNAQRLSPVPVTGGLTFTQVSGGGFHTCGVSGEMGWCWGDNQFGELGGAAFGGTSSVPGQVAPPE